MDVKTLLLLAGAVLLVLLITAKVFAAPLKVLAKVILNTALGLGALALLNATSALTGFSLGLNLFNALVLGILGMPGIGLLLLVQWIFT